jgi:hypothetical protein
LENLKGGGHLEDLGVDGKIIFEWTFRKTAWECVDWIHLAQDKDQWRAAVYTIMKLEVP